MFGVDRVTESTDLDAIKNLDQFPQLALRSKRQQWVSQNYKLIGLLPFGIVLFIVLKFFSSSTNKAWDWLVEATLLWAILVAGYGFYSLFWGVRCPACGCGFGVGQECRSCGLPRH
jgi:hypothetical protein